jgi:hypothetical protein
MTGGGARNNEAFVLCHAIRVTWQMLESLEG